MNEIKSYCADPESEQPAAQLSPAKAKNFTLKKYEKLFHDYCPWLQLLVRAVCGATQFGEDGDGGDGNNREGRVDEEEGSGVDEANMENPAKTPKKRKLRDKEIMSTMVLCMLGFSRSCMCNGVHTVLSYFLEASGTSKVALSVMHRWVYARMIIS